MESLGVVYVALGANALSEYYESVRTLRCTKNDTSVELKHFLFKDPYQDLEVGRASRDLTAEQQAHLAKTRSYFWTPFEYTLMLDADTRVRSLEDLLLGFKLLGQGWDLVIVPSLPNRPKDVLWHLSSDEQIYTFNTLGYWSHIMLNTGVVFFAKNDRVKSLFTDWKTEWLRYKDRDQGAFLRALRCNPIKIFILGQAFNSRDGEVVQHLFGRAV